MKKWTVGAVFAGILVGALSALICCVEGFIVLTAIGDRYRHDLRYYHGLWCPITLVSGFAGFYLPFAWLQRRGCRAEDVKSLLGAIRRIVSSLLLAGAFLVVWAVTGDSVLSLSSSWRAICSSVPTAAGFAAGMWLAERRSDTRRTGFLRIFIWPLVGCVVGAVAFFWIGPLIFSLGTASLAVREVLAGKRGSERGT
jgi:hypothetical protein